MKSRIDNPANERRDFLKNVATGAAALGLSMFAPPFKLSAGTWMAAPEMQMHGLINWTKKENIALFLMYLEPNEMILLHGQKYFN